MQVRIRDIRDSTVLHSLMSPMAPLIALPQTGRMDRGIRFLRRQNKNIDNVLTASVHKRGYILSAENVEPGTNQGESLIRKILNRRDKRELTVEPGLHGVLV